MARPKRFDPPSVQVDGDVNERTAYSGWRPDRHYIEANPNDDRCGVMAMRHDGYEIEVYREGGPQLRGGVASSDGSAITRFGQVLMSCPIELYLKRQRTGAEVADNRSRAIGQRGGIDQVVGPTGHVAQFAQDPGEFLERA